jgi:hypothetical protein
MQPLRIEIGGEVTLDPIPARLESDLSEFFQQPVAKLNEETRENSAASVADARRGFRSASG